MSNAIVKPSQLRTILAKTIQARVPLLIVGPPAISKTQCVLSACHDAGADKVLMHAVVRDPTDFKGFPQLTPDGADFVPFGDLRRLIAAQKPTVCFLDDLGQATPSVQAAAMQLILERGIDGQYVSDQVVFIGATNRRSDRAAVTGILEPLKSRFVSIVELAPDLNDWCAWATASGIAPEVVGFLRFRPHLLADFKPTAELTNSPLPRTWENVSRILGLDLTPDLQEVLIQGAVGEAAAIEFIAFRRAWSQMVDPDLILITPDTAPIPTEISALAAVSTAIAIRVQKESMTRYCRYLERLCAEDKDEFAALSLKTALAREPRLTNTPGYITAMSGPLGQLMVGG